MYKLLLANLMIKSYISEMERSLQYYFINFSLTELNINNLKISTTIVM